VVKPDKFFVVIPVAVVVVATVPTTGVVEDVE
jgi:hypothetical protein